ncbi:hypothetical protein EPU39_22500 [Escherichia coli]|nr:hypothetical protein [Escherichia coli]RWV43590.1 hypothetical protein EPU39_22500 [Escherichia coli]RWV54458.1 hypothetical protein EPU28_22850 [Escherichia coli]RWV69055.1 hypothetical protein EPU40_22910 [Escherichia coli]
MANDFDLICRSSITEASFLWLADALIIHLKTIYPIVLKTNQNGSSHKAANKPFNPLKILDFIIKKAKAVKLSPILSTSWAGTVEVLAAKRKDRILTLSATVTCPHD